MISDSQQPMISTPNSKELDSLPTRKSPIHTPAKIFNSCVPLSGLRRSLSLPRQNTVVSKRFSPEQNKTIHNGECAADTKLISKVYPTLAAHSPPTGLESLLSSHTYRLKEPSIKWKKFKTGHSSSNKSEKEEYSGRDNLVFEPPYLSADEKSNSPILYNSDLESPEVCLSPFYDPLLAELDAELPAPPPPPRACPPWLKSALAKQNITGHLPIPHLNVPRLDYEISSLPSPTVCNSYLSTPVQEFDQKKSLSLENNRFNVRIYPVIQNGVKISDTHYWLLDPPKPKSLRHASNLTRRATECVRVPPPSPLNEIDMDCGYMNIEATDVCPANELPLRDAKLRRGISEISQTSLQAFYRELVLCLMKQVPLATESECQAVLIGCSYDYEEANKRLKLELLCRRSHTNRSYSERLLNICNWDLDKAIKQANIEHEQRKLKKQEKFNLLNSNNKDLNKYEKIDQNHNSLIFPPYSSGSSDSSTSPQPSCSVSSISTNWLNETNPNSLFEENENTNHGLITKPI